MSLSCATTLPSCTSDRQNARRPSVQASCRQSCAQSSTPKVNGAKQQRLDSALSVRHLKADSRVKASSPQADAPTVSSKAEQDLTVQDAITRIRSIIATGNELTPFDRSSFNLAVVIWKLFASIPPDQRTSIVDALSSGDIKQLWLLASARATANRLDLSTAQAGWDSPWTDMPQEPGQEALYEGKAAVPLPSLFSRFQKSFFMSGDNQLYGRVRLRPAVLGDRLYPLYFKAFPRSTIIPATQELADMSLEYHSADRLDLDPEQLPTTPRWPKPAKTVAWPFHQGLVDYLRPIGPGVYVGVGFKQETGSNDKQFLYFVMARCLE